MWFIEVLDDVVYVRHTAYLDPIVAVKRARWDGAFGNQSVLLTKGE